MPLGTSLTATNMEVMLGLAQREVGQWVVKADVVRQLDMFEMFNGESTVSTLVRSAGGAPLRQSDWNKKDTSVSGAERAPSTYRIDGVPVG